MKRAFDLEAILVAMPSYWAGLSVAVALCCCWTLDVGRLLVLFLFAVSVLSCVMSVRVNNNAFFDLEMMGIITPSR